MTNPPGSAVRSIGSIRGSAVTRDDRRYVLTARQRLAISAAFLTLSVGVFVLGVVIGSVAWAVIGFVNGVILAFQLVRALHDYWDRIR